MPTMRRRRRVARESEEPWVGTQGNSILAGSALFIVIPGLVPGIHLSSNAVSAMDAPWIPAMNAGMTPVFEVCAEAELNRPAEMTG